MQSALSTLFRGKKVLSFFVLFFIIIALTGVSRPAFADGTCQCKGGTLSTCQGGTSFTASSLYACNLYCYSDRWQSTVESDRQGSCTESYTAITPTPPPPETNTTRDGAPQTDPNQYVCCAANGLYAPGSTTFPTMPASPNLCTQNGGTYKLASQCQSMTSEPPTPNTPAGGTTATPSSPTRVTLPNPLGTTDVNTLIGRVIKAALSVVGSLALLMFIYGGVLWMTARGNPEGVKKGQSILFWSTAGLLLIFTAYIILRYIFSALQGSVGG